MGVALWGDAENPDSQVGGDLQTQACAVTQQIHQGQHHSDPQHDVFINVAVEILIQKEESRTNEGCVRKMKLTLGHVCHHQLIRDLGDDHAKCKDVKARMVLENLTGGLFKDDEGQREDEADV